ncbi:MULTISPECIES: hypothetical protein [Cronobacter]|uniref:hypothetical protein n=1 Tax=Cronobacter TaxID=413496 RepID=UPI0021072292|nr:MULTISPECIES: hypothetical protein [Cronobacter]MDK1186572.1 hypothetical protein [Cronobacter turicensis]MDK1195033.1 hypothetical protein [Cronobacter dublinensis]MDK1203971.1 hypothetical protein [Cronobacter dublinensis]MDK1208235.1 hypothetical protein [Cronobacter turicensis]MDK1216576.1 hypothetical protein [Cronobacter turicensis]
MQEERTPGEDGKIKSEVLRQLKETLKQHRQISEDDGQPESQKHPASTPVVPAARQVEALDPERRKLDNQDFEAEIKLKKTYGIWFLIILACQLLIMNGVFISGGAGLLSFKDLTLQLYMGGTLTEVFGLVLVVTKYLFKRK